MTLKQFLSVTECSPEDIYGIFITLDKELEDLHSVYVVDKLDSDKVLVNEEGYFFSEEYIYPSDDPFMKKDNIKRLAKMTIGAYLTSSTGFMDYSDVDDEYFRNNYSSIEHFIYRDLEEDTYYKDLFFDGFDNIYHAAYIRYRIGMEPGVTASTSKKLVKRLDEASGPVTFFNYEPTKKYNAFIDVFFYPILILVFLLCFYAVNLFLKLR